MQINTEIISAGKDMEYIVEYIYIYIILGVFKANLIQKFSTKAVYTICDTTGFNDVFTPEDVWPEWSDQCASVVVSAIYIPSPKRHFKTQM